MVENKSSDKKSHISKSRIPSSPTKQKSRYNMRDIPSASPLLRSAETRRAREVPARVGGRLAAQLAVDATLAKGRQDVVARREEGAVAIARVQASFERRAVE